MKTLLFRPNSDYDEFGEFCFEVERCVSYLEGQIRSCGIARDSLLLKWISSQTNAGESPIPNDYDDRARFLAAELLETDGVRSVICTKCGCPVSVAELRREEWDDSTSNEGIRVGTSGYKLVCNHGHALLFVCTSIY